MMKENTKQTIVAYILNCPLNGVEKNQPNATQKAEIQELQQAFELCLKSIMPTLIDQGRAIVQERDYQLFTLMPSNMAIKLICDELREKGIKLDEDSMKQSLTLALDNSNGFILQSIKN